jgi:hypothetical protein
MSLNPTYASVMHCVGRFAGGRRASKFVPRSQQNRRSGCDIGRRVSGQEFGGSCVVYCRVWYFHPSLNPTYAMA